MQHSRMMSCHCRNAAMDDTMLNSMNDSWNSPVGQHSQQLVNTAA
jgi:hypothetical protein